MGDGLKTHRLLRKRQAQFKKCMAQKLAIGVTGFAITISPTAGSITTSNQDLAPKSDISKRLAKLYSWSLLSEINDTQTRTGSRNKKVERLVQWQNGWDDFNNWRNY